MLQQCLTQIDELARFSGPAEAATLKADSILEKITELQNEIELKALETSQNVDRERDQTKLLVARLRNAELAARECRREKWFKQRQQFASIKPKGELFGNRSGSESLEESDSPAIGVAEQVSSNLRRIHQLAQAEVLRSELNIEELQTSTNALTNVHNQYSGVDMLLNGSKRLVRLLDEADAKDRRNMQLALSFLGAVLIWIVYRRILKLPIKLLMWSIARFLGIVRFFSKSKADGGIIEASVDTLLEAIASTTQSAVEPIVETTLETTLETLETLETTLEPILETLETTLETALETGDLSAALHPDL